VLEVVRGILKAEWPLPNHLKAISPMELVGNNWELVIE